MTRKETQEAASLDWSNNPTIEFPVSEIQRRWATTNSVRKLARELKRELDNLEKDAELDETVLRGERVDPYTGKDPMLFSNYEEAVEALNKLTTIKRILKNKEEGDENE